MDARRVGNGVQGAEYPPRQCVGNEVDPAQEGVQLVPVVAGEALVTAVATKRDRHVFAGNAGNVVRRDRRGIRERLPEPLYQQREDREHVGTEGELLVVRSVEKGHLARVLQLVELLFPKTHGKGLHRLPRVFAGHQRDHAAGIHPAGEERSQGDVAHQADPDGLPDLLEELLLEQDPPRRGVRRMLRCKGELPVAPEFLPPLSYRHPVARRKLPDAGVRRKRGGHALEGQIMVDRNRIDFHRDLRVRHQRRQLGAKGEEVPPATVEQRLLSHAIPGKEEGLPLPVPDRDREHPPQALDARRAFLLEKVQDDLGVGAGPEPVPSRLQPGPQILEVVDFPVEDDPEGFVLVGHRLVPLEGKVDDAQPRVTQAGLPERQDPPVVRPPVAEPVACAFRILRPGGLAVPTDLPVDSAHQPATLSIRDSYRRTIAAASYSIARSFPMLPS